ncbi:MAG: hypothetical protein MUF44_06200 [Hydrogenophaga sp.]|jgi:hypothetical protein|nr:hypothetical protein [Hydrogenophaga sp.]
MKTTDRRTALSDDAELRQRLRESLAPSSSEDLQALEARALEQWRQRTAAQAHQQGPLAVVQAHWRLHPALWSGGLLALCLAALLLTKPWAVPDPALDELLQPDVLSLIAAGEL